MKQILLFTIFFILTFPVKAQLCVPKTIDGRITKEDYWDVDWELQEKERGLGTGMVSHFKMMQDAVNIYVVVEVIDSTPSNDTVDFPDSYERDNVEFYFSMKASDHENGEYGAGDWLIRCQRSNVDTNFIDGVMGTDSVLMPLSDEILDNMQYAVVSNDEGYIVEVAFPIGILADASDFDGVNFRVDVATTDNDGTQRAQHVFWSTDDIAWVYWTGGFGHAMFYHHHSSIQTKKGERFLAHKSENNIIIRGAKDLVQIFNINGQLIHSVEVNGDGIIDVSDFKPGLYVITNNNSSVKIIK